MTMRRYPSEQLQDLGSDRALYSALLPAPALDGGDDNDADWVARGLTSSGCGFNAALVGSVVVAVEGRGRGGGKEACGIPGGGEEDKDRGREVQGGVDEAQRGREVEGGGSVVGRDPYGVPRVGGELGRGGRWQRRRPGIRQPRGRCPPHCVLEGGGLSSHPLSIVADPWTVMARMVDKKWNCNRSY